VSDKELWELMSIISEGQDTEQRRKVEQYITDLQKEIENLKEQQQVLYDANRYHQNIIHELETMKPPNQLYGENVRLRSQLQQKENIIKEVREYIMSELITEWDIKNGGNVSGSDLPVEAITLILDILEKEKQCTNCGQEKEQ
jgi:hypothetical protein